MCEIFHAKVTPRDGEAGFDCEVVTETGELVFQNAAPNLGYAETLCLEAVIEWHGARVEFNKL